MHREIHLFLYLVWFPFTIAIFLLYRFQQGRCSIVQLEDNDLREEASGFRFITLTNFRSTVCYVFRTLSSANLGHQSESFSWWDSRVELFVCSFNRKFSVLTFSKGLIGSNNIMHERKLEFKLVCLFSMVTWHCQGGIEL